MTSGTKRFSRFQKLTPCTVLISSTISCLLLCFFLINLLGLSCTVPEESNAVRVISNVLSDSRVYGSQSDSLNNEEVIGAPILSENNVAGVDVTTGERADWGKDVYKSHPFCKTIIDEPIKATTPLCKRNPDMSCANGNQIGKTPLFSQVAQDFYIYSRHFKYLTSRKGVYLEAGTRHPVTGSNTYFMDACLRWKGVCVEGNPETLSSIHRARSCELVPTCVTKLDGTYFNFLINGESGGIEESNKNIGKETHRTVHNVKLRCMSLQVIFERRNIKTLDYLSLDVEGHELDVLKGLDHTKSKINVMTIETTAESLLPIQQYLETLGYVRHIPDLDESSLRVGLLRDDAVFLHKDVVWGKPV